MKLTDFSTGYRNKKTTVAGALLGTALYGQQIGLGVPQNGEQWGAFIVAVLAAVLGLLAKDAGRAEKRVYKQTLVPTTKKFDDGFPIP